MTDFSTGRNLHIDAVLSNLVINRRPSGFIADALVPVLNVSKQSDVFYRRNYLENRLYDANLTARAPGTEARKVAFSVSSDTYYAKNYALGAEWPVEDEANADEVLQYAQEHAILVMDRLMIDYEMRIAAIANTAANVATTTHVATPWDLQTTARPISDLMGVIEAFRQATGERPNTLVIPEQVSRHLRINDQVRDLLFGQVQGGVATEQQIANLLKVERILVPELLINSAGVGPTLAGSGANSNAWGNFVHVAKISPLPGRNVDTWLQAFRWTNPAFGQPMAVQRYPFDPKKKVYGIEASYYQAEKVISTDLCWRIDSLIA